MSKYIVLNKRSKKQQKEYHSKRKGLQPQEGKREDQQRVQRWI